MVTPIFDFMMFFQSILQSFAYFKNPQFLLSVGLLLLSQVLYLLLIRWSTRAPESQDAAAPGCLTSLVGLLFQAFVTTTFVLLWMPVFFGLSSEISLVSVQPYAIVALRAGIFALIVVSVLSFVPYLGRFIAKSPGLEMGITATLVFRLVAPVFFEKELGLQSSAQFPSIAVTLLFLLLVLFLSSVLKFVFEIISRRMAPEKSSGAALLPILKPSIDILAGILPFLAYVKYVQLLM